MKRQTAYKAAIRDLLEGEEQQNEEFQTSQILLRGKAAGRINLAATVVAASPEEKSCLLDDGTGTIKAMFFEQQASTSLPQVGDTIIITGRIRVYGGNRYVSAETEKKADTRAIALRKLELEKESLLYKKAPAQAKEEYEGAEEMVVEEADTKAMMLRSMIKELDEASSGNGADEEEIIRKSNLPNPETIIRGLIEVGEVFEVRPGKLKVME
ncbi:OB-fold nucleic acid binding domain-containing protein [Candidatus Woesearchaeota archaeon]|nr:OB-fold nucleic acid binding domain-containing protein [Candidatus Woesearchaeota archaeon]